MLILQAIGISKHPSLILKQATLYWQSKMQTIISLSTAESDLIAVSEATRFDRSITYIIDDNAAALEISKSPKIRSHTQHINVLYRYFRSEIENERITVEPIKMNKNIEDFSTKQ
jgi:hypothetical protein